MAFLSQEHVVTPDRIERAAPLSDLFEPAPGEARHAVAGAPHAHLGGDELDDFLVAVSETVTNAIEHGAPTGPVPVLGRPGPAGRDRDRCRSRPR